MYISIQFKIIINYLISTIMMTRDEFNFKGVQVGSQLTVNNWVLVFVGKGGSCNQYWKVDATFNGAEKYKGACKTLSNWKDIIFGPVEGKTTGSKIPAKVDNSQQKGEHKVISVSLSTNKLSRQHRKLMLALSDITSVLPNTSDDIVNIIQSRWYEHAEEVRRSEAEAEARKAAIAAKKQAEEAAKKQAEEQKLRRAMIEGYAKKQGIPLDKAEAALVAIGII